MSTNDTPDLDTIRAETVARVLREHRTARHVGGNGMWTVNCGCGWSTNMQPIGRDDEIHRAHQAATIVTSLDAVMRAWIKGQR